MNESYVFATSLPDYPLWEKLKGQRIPFSFDLEITARCNNNCRHCYINLPSGNREAQEKELTLKKISSLADQAVELGTLWVLITGGEPLLRPDFPDIYLSLKRKGLMVSVFTNAGLITKKEIKLFREFPPRELEVTVYGIRQETYEKVTRRPGSYKAFRRGLDLLLTNGISVRLKAMALRSNFGELPDIAQFCRRYSKDYFRFDPLLHLRFDGDPERNQFIREERLSPPEIAVLEQADVERLRALKKECVTMIDPLSPSSDCRYLFQCGAGKESFSISYDGLFRLCSSLWHPECTFDLGQGRLKEAWTQLVPRVRAMTSDNPDFSGKCHSCSLFNLCLWCPAHAHLETGRMDGWVDYFCQVAKARAAALKAQG